ncbi:MAG: uroporphyrinogen decarboxylase [Verrucomicrobiales bacterium]|nr:uroporphyrinogen decarboxylase [Verrucomicrobiales bacterium]
MSSEAIKDNMEVAQGLETMSNRERFQRALRCQNSGRPPVWLMRQAGRVLPEYRELKEKHSFVEMVRTPELATQVTLQPIERFGFDAAILFSDILVISEAMGQKYGFREQGGIEMEFTVDGAAEIDRLNEKGIADRLDYVAKALPMIRKALGEETGLIGFSGAPWTLANYMMEGGSAKEFLKAKELFYSDRKQFDRLMGKLTVAVTEYLQMQIDAGVDALQIFDTQGSCLAASDFMAASGRWIGEIIAGLKNAPPVIVFAKGVNSDWASLASTGASVLSVDWTVDLPGLRKALPEGVGIQGNLDPYLLRSTPEIVAREAGKIMDSMEGFGGHIFNLGHGVTPECKLDCLESLVNTVRAR